MVITDFVKVSGESGTETEPRGFLICHGLFIPISLSNAVIPLLELFSDWTLFKDLNNTSI